MSEKSAISRSPTDVLQVRGSRKPTPVPKDFELRYDYMLIALRILESAKKEYASYNAMIDSLLGPPIGRDEAHQVLASYLSRSKINGKLRIRWDPSLPVAGRVFVATHSKRPEDRVFTLVVYDSTAQPQQGKDEAGSPSSSSSSPASSKRQRLSLAEAAAEERGELTGDSAEVSSGPHLAPTPVSAAAAAAGEGGEEQPRVSDTHLDVEDTEQVETANSSVLRKLGIECFAAHEIGTHLVRTLNDGYQVWASDRKKWGLGATTSREGVAAEEGLAMLSTVIHQTKPWLYSTALLYYASARAKTLTRKQLVEDLAPYLPDRTARERMAARIKSSLPNPAGVGGNGRGQAYFEGVLQLLYNADGISWRLMHCGKLSLKDIPRIARTARTSAMSLPWFVRDEVAYRTKLKHIIRVNRLWEPIVLSPLAPLSLEGPWLSTITEVAAALEQQLPPLQHQCSATARQLQETKRQPTPAASSALKSPGRPGLAAVQTRGSARSKSVGRRPRTRQAAAAHEHRALATKTAAPPTLTPAPAQGPLLKPSGVGVTADGPTRTSEARSTTPPPRRRSAMASPGSSAAQPTPAALTVRTTTISPVLSSPIRPTAFATGPVVIPQGSPQEGFSVLKPTPIATAAAPLTEAPQASPPLSLDSMPFSPVGAPTAATWCQPTGNPQPAAAETAVHAGIVRSGMCSPVTATTAAHHSGPGSTTNVAVKAFARRQPPALLRPQPQSHGARMGAMSKASGDLSLRPPPARSIALPAVRPGTSPRKLGIWEQQGLALRRSSNPKESKPLRPGKTYHSALRMDSKGSDDSPFDAFSPAAFKFPAL